MPVPLAGPMGKVEQSEHELDPRLMLRRRAHARRAALYQRLRDDGQLSERLCGLVAEVLSFVGETGDEWLSHTNRR